MTYEPQGSSLACAAHISRHRMRHLHALMLCVWFSATPFLFLLSFFSLRLFILLALSFFFHDVVYKYPAHFANEDLGTLAEYDLSQGMSPTTTTSRRPLNRTSRNPPARTGPWTRMTSSTMTTPSALRSLQHCSPRSEKMQRAVDELITLMTKVCRPVSRRLSVIEQGDLLWNSLIH